MFYFSESRVRWQKDATGKIVPKDAWPNVRFYCLETKSLPVISLWAVCHKSDAAMLPWVGPFWCSDDVKSMCWMFFGRQRSSFPLFSRRDMPCLSMARQRTKSLRPIFENWMPSLWSLWRPRPGRAWWKCSIKAGIHGDPCGFMGIHVAMWGLEEFEDWWRMGMDAESNLSYRVILFCEAPTRCLSWCNKLLGCLSVCLQIAATISPKIEFAWGGKPCVSCLPSWGNLHEF